MEELASVDEGDFSTAAAAPVIPPKQKKVSIMAPNLPPKKGRYRRFLIIV